MKKVRPLEIINNSIPNLSSNENLQDSGQLSCRFCNVTHKGNLEDDSLLYPCTCPLPIHRNCLYGEMKNSHLNPNRHVMDRR